nr:globin-coupled sensor protein [Bacillus xiapuensis]
MKLFKSKETHTENEPLLFSANHQAKLSVQPGTELAEQVKMIDLTIDDLKAVKSLYPLVKASIHTIVDRFYSAITRQTGLLAIIEKNSSVDRLKKTLQIHVEELFEGKVDEEFVQKRIQIARVHVRVGLKTKWYMSAFQELLNSLIALIAKQQGDAEQKLTAVGAITKLLNLEQQLVLEAYEQESQRIRSAEAKQKEELTSRVYAISQELAAISEQTNASLKELGEQSGSILQLSKEGMSLAEESSKHSTAGQEQLKEQGHKLSVIKGAVTDIQAFSTELNDIASSITDVITIVGNIAGQTNLLALNASIEAARAGEYGKGFAVVAEEIRKLSDQTKESTASVSDHILKTNALISQVSQAVETVNDLVDKGIGSMNKTDEDFDQLLELIAQTKRKNQEIENQLQKLSHIITEIEEASEEVANSAVLLNDSTEEYLQLER